METALKTRYPSVRWLGVLPRDVLADLYASADVFAFPSRNETFGLVMLEAMACGTPVAAFPVDGPLEVVGIQTGGSGQRYATRGGILHDDLGQAAAMALLLPRSEARQQALEFSWSAATDLFVKNLVNAR
jgi:glycosyltransferase involved in cell wall biosynthesis